MSTSGGPNSRSMFFTTPLTAPSSVTLATKPFASVPPLCNSRIAPSTRSGSISMIAIRAPSRAKAAAVANPMPDAPPVTIAHLPFKLPAIIPTFPLYGRVAAIHHQSRTVEVTRLRSGQKCYRRRDVLARAAFVLRDARQNFLAQMRLIEPPLSHGRCDHTGTKRHAAYAGMGIVGSDRAAELDDRSLRGRIGGTAGKRDQPSNRSDVDDHTAALFDHDRKRWPAASK